MLISAVRHAQPMRVHRAAPQPQPEFMDTVLTGRSQDLMVVWKTSVPARVLAAPAVAPDGSLAFVHDGGLTVLNADGDKTQEYTGTFNLFRSPVFLPDGRVAVAAPTGLQVLGPDGWSKPIGSLHTAPAVDDEGNLYAATKDGKVFSYTSDGEERWSQDVAPELLSYVHHRLRSLLRREQHQLENGQGFPGLEQMHADLKERLKDPDYGRDGLGRVNGGPLLAPDGTAYLFTEAGPLLALDSADGSLEWSGHRNFEGLSFAPDGHLVATTSNSQLKLMDAEGRTEWRYATFAERRVDELPPEQAREADIAGNFGAAGPPAISPGGDRYYTIGLDAKLRAVTPEGKKVWTVELSKDTAYSPSVQTGEDGTIYACTPRGVDAVSPEGDILWSFRVKDQYAHLALAGDRVCLATYSGNVYLLDRDFIKVRAAQYLENPDAGPPPAIELDDGFVTIGGFTVDARD